MDPIPRDLQYRRSMAPAAEAARQVSIAMDDDLREAAEATDDQLGDLLKLPAWRQTCMDNLRGRMDAIRNRIATDFRLDQESLHRQQAQYELLRQLTEDPHSFFSDKAATR